MMNFQKAQAQAPDCPCQECTFMDKDGHPMDCTQCTEWYLEYERYRRDIERGLADERSDIRKEGPLEPSSLRTLKISIPRKGGDF